MKIIKENNEELVIEIQGLTHTLANVVSKKLNTYPEVKFAGYTMTHPLVPKPVFRIITNGKTKPKDVLIRALKEIIDTYEEFKEKYKAALAELS